MAANLVFSSLPIEEQERLRPFLERVELADGEELVRAGASIPFLWFIEDAVILTTQTTPSGVRLPAGLAGVDGVAGFELWLGRDVSPLSSVAEIGGKALRMRSLDLRRQVLQASSPLNRAIADYVFYFVTMGVQIAACLEQHPAEERLCRWLRMIQQRAPGRSVFPISESLLATLMHTQPHTAVLAVRVLERAGLIEYRDRQMRILDRQGLADGCCECFAIFHERLARLQGTHGNA